MAKRKVRKIPTVLTKGQIKDFLGYFAGDTKVKQRNLLLTKTLLRTGARANEALHMRYEDLILDDEGKAFYHLKQSKNGSQMQIPLPPDIYEGILELSDVFNSNKQGYVFRPVSKDIPLASAYLRDVYRKAGVSIGLPFKMSPHKLRSTFASYLFAETGDIYLVSKLLNHSNISVTEIYTKVFTSAKRKAVDELHLY